MSRRAQISQEHPASADAPQQALSHRRAHKGRIRVVKAVVLGGVVALVTKANLRSRLLDAVFGPEEHFHYDSVTEPVAPEIEPWPAGTPQGAADAPGSGPSAHPRTDGFSPASTLHADAAATASVVEDSLARSPGAPSAGETPDPAPDDASAPGADAPGALHGGTALADDPPAAAAYDARVSTYEMPTAAYGASADAPGFADDARGSTDDRPASVDEAPAPTEEATDAAHAAPTSVYDAPSAAHDVAATNEDAAPGSLEHLSAWDDPTDPVHRMTDSGDDPAFARPASGSPDPAGLPDEPGSAAEAPTAVHAGSVAPEQASPFVHDTGAAAESAEAPAEDGPAPDHAAPADPTPVYQYEYPVYEPPPVAVDWSAPDPALDPPTASSEDSTREPPSVHGGPSPASSDHTADAEREPPAPAAQPVAPEGRDVPASDLPSDASTGATEPAAPAGQEEPGIGEAAPRRSGWWVPRRRGRDAAPEPPRWE